MSARFQGLVDRITGCVQFSQQSTSVRPADAVDFRGMAVSPAGMVYSINDTGQPRVFQDGIAIEPATGLVITSSGPVANISMGGLAVTANGSVVLNSPPDVIHQGVGLTNAGEACSAVAAVFIGFEADPQGEIQSLLLGTGLNFTRASTPTFQDWEGITRTAEDNEIRIQLARRVRTHFLESLLSATGWRSFNGSTFVDGASTGQIDMGFTAVGPPSRVETNRLVFSGVGNLVGEGFLLSFEAKTTTAESGRGFQTQLGRYTGGAGAVRLDTFTATDQFQRFVLGGSPNFTDPLNEGLRASFWGFDAGAGDCSELSVKNILIERVTGQADQSPTPIPGEYTSPGVEYGANVKGVRVFNHRNASTVSGGVVTYAKGPDLTTAWGALFDPAVLEAPSAIFDFSNFDITEGTFVFDLTMAAASNQGIVNFANTEAGVISYDTVNQFRTSDGTNQATVDPSLSANLGDTIRFAVPYDVTGGLSIGYKNITDGGAWVWDTDSASFDGAFTSNNVFNLFYNLSAISTIARLYFYETRLTNDFIENVY